MARRTSASNGVRAIVEHRGYDEPNCMTYIQGMELGVDDKARMADFIPKDAKLIVDAGAGGGASARVVAQKFPSATVYAVDSHASMVKSMQQAVADRVLPSNILVLAADATREIPSLSGRADAITASSFFHEPFSHEGWSSSHGRVVERPDLGKAALERAIRAGNKMLKKGGVYIVRDAYRPPSRQVILHLLTPEMNGKLGRFLSEFRADFGHKVSHSKTAPDAYRLDLVDCMEFLRKYHYDANWKHEMIERHGYLEMSELKKLFRKNGFKIVHSQPYNLAPLVEICLRHARIDARLPPTHFLLVAEKTRELPEKKG